VGQAQGCTRAGRGAVCSIVKECSGGIGVVGAGTGTTAAASVSSKQVI
jgi:NCAIR mutase (PurE)-related protein